CKAPVPADHPLDQAFMREMVEAAILAVALARGIDQRQVSRLALRVGRLAFAGEIKLLERDRDLLGKADADEAAGCNRVAVADQHDSFGRRDDLALLRVAQIGQSWMLAHGIPPCLCGPHALFLLVALILSRGVAREQAAPRFQAGLSPFRAELSCVFRWRNRPTRR